MEAADLGRKVPGVGGNPTCPGPGALLKPKAVTSHRPLGSQDAAQASGSLDREHDVDSRGPDACALALAAPAFATPVEDFRDLIADYEAFNAERNLGARARAGDLEAAASWPDMSIEAIERWDEGMAGFDARIDAIEPNDLPADEQANYAVLAYELDSAVAVAGRGGQRITKGLAIGSSEVLIHTVLVRV